MSLSRLFRAPLLFAAVSAVELVAACASDSGGSNHGVGARALAGAGGSFAGGAAAGGGGDVALAGRGASGGAGSAPEIHVDPSAGGSDDRDARVCASVTASAELEPVYLAFAFDVSGSMGKGDKPWHDASLKWDPVVAATRGFFEDVKSSGLSASLTAFPKDAGEDERCDPDSYSEPDVQMQTLPSAAFGEQLDAIRAEDWRGGTPTLAVIEGVLAQIDASRADRPGHYALVLVTDGYPQDCDDDSIESVEVAVSAVASEIPTYVIGVKNPPITDDDGTLAPDTVSNLSGVAQAGGTGAAFIIDTGDPSSTTAMFARAVEQIRGVSISCNVAVPAPPDGRMFEKDHVVVGYASGASVTELAYDANCSTDQGWHYDHLEAPREVVLCPGTCATVQADPEAKLDVAFTCEPVAGIPR